MSEEATTETTADASTEAQEAEPKTFDAEYVQKLRAEAAKYRTEAKANADAAKRLAEIEESQKTEAQKAADRLAAAEREREEARAEALRWKVAAKHGIDDEDAALFLTASDEETLTKQATRLAARTAQGKRNGNYVPREGTTSKATPNDERAAVQALFGGGG